MNCKRCTRWRLITDFKWRWRKVRSTKGSRQRHEVPTIDTICESCRRAIERARYHAKSLAERQEIGRRVNAKAQERKQREAARVAEQLRLASITKGLPKSKYGGSEMLPLMPFRLWLLVAIRERGGVQAFANQIERDESQIRRYAEGIYWESDCRPRPVNGVTLDVVDDILSAAGSQYQLGILYPLSEE